MTINRFLFLLAGLAMACHTPAMAAELPGTGLPYATYRKQLLGYGWRPIRHCGTPYPEACTGNAMGTVWWQHPVDGRRVEIFLWPCRHGWCLAPSVSEAEEGAS
jgi:hypothetical protein